MTLSASEVSTVISDEIPSAFVAEDESQSKTGKIKFIRAKIRDLNLTTK